MSTGGTGGAAKRILVIPPSRLHPAARAVLGADVEVVDGADLDPAAFTAALAGAHAIVGAVTPERLAAAGALEVIGVPGSGTDHIDVTGATARGVLVVNAAGGQATAVAEHAVGLMLALAKRIAVSDRIFHTEGRFVGREHFTGPGWPGWPHEIGGSTIGIVGFGAIGRDLTRKCRLGFDMTVLAHDPYCPPSEITAHGATPVAALPDLLGAVDWLSLHVPLTEATRGMIGAAELRAMRPTAALINLARGGVVDEDALLRALREGWIAGAGLDVFAEEPGPDGHPLYGLDQVVCTAHIGGWVEEAVPRLAAIMAEEMLVALRGDRPGRLVNPAAWDHRRAAGATT
ncbi:MAG: NAD(P)-dependent oxidoreductase [Actinomycetota bacterium]